jgi:hypothetical protein
MLMLMLLLVLVLLCTATLLLTLCSAVCCWLLLCATVFLISPALKEVLLEELLWHRLHCNHEWFSLLLAAAAAEALCRA